MNRRTPLAVLAGLVVLAPLTAAEAGPKTIKKTYSVTAAPFPHPTAGRCAESPDPVSEHRETLKTPAPGVLNVKVTWMGGDWDAALFDEKGSSLAAGSGSDTPNSSTEGTESIVYKNKKARTIFIDVCNFLGGPTASVTYIYTY